MDSITINTLTRKVKLYNDYQENDVIVNIINLTTVFHFQLQTLPIFNYKGREIVS